jgi:4-amino-4-deoxy-L-arabinose transferase-like glycosyltransferase
MLAIVAALPRLAVLLYERSDILAAYTEKSDDFARTLVASGTFGLIPGEPSAYTQPLYAFFLTPLYWIFGRHWPVVGLAQVAVAVVTAWLVYEVGRRILADRRLAAAAAAIATLEPYALWHDVHVNREILDAPLAAALVLLTLVACERGSRRWWAALGAVSAVAVLSNVRLLALPLVLLAYLAWRRGLTARTLAGCATLLVAFVVVLVPWPARNEAQVGCFTITTDSLALWKANNPRTYATLARGGWIDDVLPQLTVPTILAHDVRSPLGTEVVLDGRRLPVTTEDAARVYRASGVLLPVDECAQMRHYQGEVLDYWRDHPGEKARLAAQATAMLWTPQVPETEGRQGAGTLVDRGRSIAEPVYLIPLYALALVGLLAVPLPFGALAVLLLGYQTGAAAVFAGTTRYRSVWDFLIVVLAVAGAARLYALLRGKRPVERVQRLRGTVGSEGG